MAGIIAASSSKTMVEADTAVDNSIAGFITGEQITLTVTDASPSSIRWGQSIPSASTPSRSGLDDDDVATVYFTPDVGGFYTLTAVVDGTTYVLRISVAAVAQNTIEGSLGFQPLTDASVPTPSSGANQYWSSDQGGLVLKLSSTLVVPLGGYGYFSQAYFVGKHGSDSADGKSPATAFLTISAAITAASAQTPSASNLFDVVVLDAGIYTENVSVPSYVSVFAPRATIVGSAAGSPVVTLADESRVQFAELQGLSNQDVLFKSSGSGAAYANVQKIVGSGTGDCVFNNGGSGVLQAWVNQLFVGAGGVGVGDKTNNIGHTHIFIEDLYLAGAAAIGIYKVSTGSIVGRVTHMLETGGGVGTGTGFDINGGSVDLFIGEVNCTTAWDVANPGTLNAFVLELTGAQTGGGTINVTTP